MRAKPPNPPRTCPFFTPSPSPVFSPRIIEGSGGWKNSCGPGSERRRRTVEIKTVEAGYFFQQIENLDWRSSERIPRLRSLPLSAFDRPCLSNFHAISSYTRNGRIVKFSPFFGLNGLLFTLARDAGRPIAFNEGKLEKNPRREVRKDQGDVKSQNSRDRNFPRGSFATFVTWLPKFRLQLVHRGIIGSSRRNDGGTDTCRYRSTIVATIFVAVAFNHVAWYTCSN